VSSRILVVEDEEGIADFIRRGLILTGYEVEVVHKGEEALAAVREQAPDLVVLDLMLPDMDGVEVCRRLRAADDVPVVMLTARDSVEDKVRGLDAGADDYVTKPFAFEELLARVRAALRRRASPEDVLTVGDLTIRPASREVSRGGRVIGLTTREYDLLEYLARRAGKVVNKESIFEDVWGFDYDGESDAIKVYVRYLRKKLNGPGERDLIHAVRGVGYILKG
jgi:two-component system response regulator MprA